VLVIVGSGALWPTPEIISIALSRIIDTDPVIPLGVRVPRGSDEPTTPLERFVAEVGPSLGRVIKRCRADTNKRGDVYRRDYEMVEHSVAVLAFFAPDQEMEGGTGHVVQAALARNIPVEAYRMAETGRPELLGSDAGAVGGWIDPNQISFPPYTPQQGTPIYITGVSNGTSIITTSTWTPLTDSTSSFTFDFNYDTNLWKP